MKGWLMVHFHWFKNSNTLRQGFRQSPTAVAVNKSPTVLGMFAAVFTHTFGTLSTSKRLPITCSLTALRAHFHWSLVPHARCGGI